MRARDFGISTLVLVPLTTGNNRLGAFGFSSVAPFDPSPAEIAFLERVASEFAVAVEAFLANQEAVRERDRLRTLFDITNALVSKLERDELFSAISEQTLEGHPARLRAADAVQSRPAASTCTHCIAQARSARRGSEGRARPCGHALGRRCSPPENPSWRTTPISTAIPNPGFRRFVELGVKSDLLGSVDHARSYDRHAGRCVERRRMTGLPEDVEFLVQVASQIAMTVSNSLAYRELEEMKERLATEKLYLEDEICLDQNIGNMVGQGPAFHAVLKGIQTVAPTDATVLITGETGTGKELVARAIHELSSRSKGSFVKVNCAAIPASLLESELFGHEKGSFTGAVAQKIGRFEVAHHGTLFLDEIGEMPLELQPKLLRAHSGPGVREGWRQPHNPDRRPAGSRH